MEVKSILHMTGGQGETSYAMNSQLQRVVISKAKAILQNTVIDLYLKTLPKCFTIADLGCSSGPNSLLVISEIIDAVLSASQELGQGRSPEFLVMLNDLPGNDFNTLFQSIQYFVEKLREDKGEECGPCFISGVPGSFFGRLFPSQSLNFVHSSCSLKFLSQVPSGVENNKRDIFITKTSPPNVLKAYLMQFQKDFSAFLSSRSEEIVPGGRMVLTTIGRRSSDPSSSEWCDMWVLMAKSLQEMVYQGLIEMENLDSFYLPVYYAIPEEIITIIQEQGSFQLDLLEMFDVTWYLNNDLGDQALSGQYVSRNIRAFLESVISSHFGEMVIEDLFYKYAEHVGEHMEKNEGKTINLVLCMTRKG